MQSLMALKSETNRYPRDDPSLFVPGFFKTRIGVVNVDSDRRMKFLSSISKYLESIAARFEKPTGPARD
eukprot:SAG31_NODE_30421_length_381_cov_1.081560_1_plen_69_part_00